MELGQLLRRARLEAGLSQRELCGDQISRNMLSQIENGSAHPSMETLSYLAQKLNKPISYFLDEQTIVSPNNELMKQAKATFAEGNYGQTLSLLTQYQPNDPIFDWEYYLLEAQSCIELAATAIQKNHSAHAAQLLERAARAGELTPYYNDATRRQRLLLCQVSDKSVALPPDDEALLIRAGVSIGEGKPDRALQYLDAVENKTSPQWNFMRGKACMAQKNYEDAIPHLKAAEDYRPQECDVMLEQACREMEDYKGAYFYACKLQGRKPK